MSSSSSYYKICSLDDVEKVWLAYDDNNIASSSTESTFKISSNNNNNQKQIVEAWICPCAPKYYCLVDDGSNK